jgi:hypothetical protein
LPIEYAPPPPPPSLQLYRQSVSPPNEPSTMRLGRHTHWISVRQVAAGWVYSSRGAVYSVLYTLPELIQRFLLSWLSSSSAIWCSGYTLYRPPFRNRKIFEVFKINSCCLQINQPSHGFDSSGHFTQGISSIQLDNVSDGPYLIQSVNFYRTASLLIIPVVLSCKVRWIHRLNFERLNFEWLNFERLNFERPNFERPNLERLNFERPNFERLNFEKDSTLKRTQLWTTQLQTTEVRKGPNVECDSTSNFELWTSKNVQAYIYIYKISFVGSG